MTGNQYKAIIDSFHVETNPKYQPSGSTTYCNIFAQDVMDECGTPLPSGVCATMLNQLESGYSSWGSVTYQNAQVRANNGYPTIAITSDHVAVVRPTKTAPPRPAGVKLESLRPAVPCSTFPPSIMDGLLPALMRLCSTLGAPDNKQQEGNTHQLI